jgi:hypothetical protein
MVKLLKRIKCFVTEKKNLFWEKNACYKLSSKAHTKKKKKIFKNKRHRMIELKIRADTATLPVS